MKRLPFAACCLCLWVAWISSAPVQKTPLDMQAIFIGRCDEYQYLLRPEFFPEGKRKNCSRLWEVFKSAFAFKRPCEVAIDSYENYSTEADHYINTTNSVMFWNGKVFPFVVDYSADTRRYVIVRDILAVYTVRNIENWCGEKGGSGLDFSSCPEWGQCTNLSVSSFWMHMSKKFALKARGTVNVMLNASSGTAFLQQSTFGTMELASLDASTTPRMIAHLVRNLDEAPKETCTSGSLLKLRKLVEDKKMIFECREDEKDIRLLQCVDQPGKKDCKPC